MGGNLKAERVRMMTKFQKKAAAEFAGKIRNGEISLEEFKAKFGADVKLIEEIEKILAKPAKKSAPAAVKITGQVVRLTEKAILFKSQGVESWIPKSQIKSTDEVADFDVIYIPAWLAQEKGLA